MKTISLFSVLFSLLIMPMTGMAQAKPDLRVSQIMTPGGLKQGDCNKVRVNVTNSQQAGVTGEIVVILFISQNGQQPTSYVQTFENIGPNDNYGQPVWFHNIPLGGTTTVTIRAKVNPDFLIEESVFNNNDKIKDFNVAGSCGSSGETASTGSSSSGASSGGSSGSSSRGGSSRGGSSRGGSITPGATAAFSLMAYNPRVRMRGGKKAPVSEAKVTLSKGRQTYTGMTGKDGKVDIKAPNGYYTMKIAKKGCRTITRKYKIPGRKAQIALSCR